MAGKAWQPGDTGGYIVSAVMEQREHSPMFCSLSRVWDPAPGLVALTPSGSSLSSQAFLGTSLESQTEVCVSMVYLSPVELMLKISHDMSTVY